MSEYLPVTPVAYVRTTRNAKWKPKPSLQRYWQYRDAIRASGVAYEEGNLVTFHLPMPKSWSGKKRQQMLGKPHRQKPDLDNLIKGLLDAIHYKADTDDSVISCIMARKIWSDQGGITIDVGIL